MVPSDIAHRAGAATLLLPRTRAQVGNTNSTDSASAIHTGGAHSIAHGLGLPGLFGRQAQFCRPVR